MQKKTYHIIALGGTFDHLHAGHAHFLNFAWQLGEHLHIGLTHQKLTKGKPWPKLIQPYQTRKKQIESFCHQKQISAATNQLTDIYGPTLDPKKKVKALVVTEKTVVGADKINQVRQAMGLKKLPVHICPFLRDEQNKIISSERIRAGEINRHGLIFAEILNKNLTLTQKQRQFLSQPQGQLVKKAQSKTKQTPLICVVGDSSLEQFIKNDWSYDLGIYDHKQQRETVIGKNIAQLKPNWTTKNPAGTMTQDLTQTLQKALQAAPQKPQHLFVKGEEDLAAVALALISPLQTQIYYGQPQQSLVLMTVTLKLKNKLRQLLQNS